MATQTESREFIKAKLREVLAKRPNATQINLLVDWVRVLIADAPADDTAGDLVSESKSDDATDVAPPLADPTPTDPPTRKTRRRKPTTTETAPE